MQTYCKAYYLRDLRQFPGWALTCAEGARELADTDIVYLWDDFTVVRSPVQSGGILFDAITPEWQAFCTQVLGFEIPEDLRRANAPRVDEHHVSAEASPEH